MTTAVSRTTEEAFVDSPFDFSGYLARRFGTSVESARSDLGRWLASYEPTSSKKGVRICRSGVFAAPGTEETGPNAKLGAA